MTIGKDPASIQIQNGRIISSQFDDIYFSTENACLESDYVFLKGNSLEDRFLQMPPGSVFAIGETGFGTGLNFLLTAGLFLQQPNGTLHFHSAEKYPLTTRQICEALDSIQNDILPLSYELKEELLLQLKRSDYRSPGFTTVFLAHGRIRLTVMTGDVLDMLKELNGFFDAWFLDGFAPAKNPEMWSAPVLNEIARLSGSHTTLSTFTSAGHVRRTLESSGFTVKRIPGFGSKRQMTIAVYNSSRLRPSKAGPITIAGAGISGLTTAWSFNRRGFQTEVYEAEKTGSGSSGNPAGIIMPATTREPTAASRFSLHAMNTMASLIDTCSIKQISRGIAVFPENEKDRVFDFAQSHGLSADSCRSFSNQILYLKNARTVRPKQILDFFIKDADLLVRENDRVVDFSEDLKTGKLLIRTEYGVSEHSGQLILCNANEVNELLARHSIPVAAVRGQILVIDKEYLLSVHKRAARLIQSVARDGYLIGLEKSVLIGATFDMHLSEKERLPERDRYLLQLADSIISGFSNCDKIPEAAASGRVCFRCQSRDYLPVAGKAVRHEEHFITDPKPLDAALISRLPHIIINTGHGSRGLSTSLLTAEILADEAADLPGPVENSLRQSTDPARFWTRELKRNAEHRRWWQS